MKTKNIIFIISLIVTGIILNSCETTEGASAVSSEATISKNSEKIVIKDGMNLSGKATTPLQSVCINMPTPFGSKQEDYFDLTDVDFSGRIIEGFYVNPDWYSHPGRLVNCKFIGSLLKDFHSSGADISSCDFTDTSLGYLSGKPVSFREMNFDFSGNNDPLSPLHWWEDENSFSMGKNSLNYFTTAQFASTKNYTQPFRQKKINPLRRKLIEQNIKFTDADNPKVVLSFDDFDFDHCFIAGLMPEMTFHNAVIFDSMFVNDFSYKQLTQTKSYKELMLEKMVFLETNFSYANFSKMCFVDCKLIKTEMLCANLEDAILIRTNFKHTKNLTLEQIKSTWNYKVGRMSGIQLPPDIAEALEKEKTE